MVRRVEFDALLLDLAREAGAEILEGVEVSRARESRDGVSIGARDGREFEARLVIAADGVNSVVARRLGINVGWPAARVAIDMMEETPGDTLRSVDPDTLWVAYGYGGSEGYAYVFPKAEHVNVGIGYVLEWFRAHVDEAPYELQRRFVGELQQRGVLDGTSSRSHFTPFLIPVGGPLRKTATNRVLLAGDAGGFVNGITAEGIYYAMVSGDLAGRAAARGVTAGYQRLWRGEIGGELRDAVLVQRHLLTTPDRINRLIGAAHRAPHVADAIIRYAMGEVSVRPGAPPVAERFAVARGATVPRRATARVARTRRDANRARVRIRSSDPSLHSPGGRRRRTQVRSRSARAASSAGQWNRKPSACAFPGTTRWPASSAASAISPSAMRRANPGARSR